MLLGKRPRRPIKRTTSMSGISTVECDQEPSDHVEGNSPIHHHHHNNMMNGYDQSFLAMISPRYNTHNFDQAADFLRTCGLCQRRLASGKDIYMYRGDTAFCSLECREKKMKQDESYTSSTSSSSSKHQYRASSPPKATTKSSHMTSA